MWGTRGRSGSAARRLVVLSVLAGALFVLPARANAAPSDCNTAGRVCVWSGVGYSGTFSWWAASDTGCKNHVFNPSLRSFWNRTSNGISIPADGIYVFPGVMFDRNPPASAITAPICI